MSANNSDVPFNENNKEILRNAMVEYEKLNSSHFFMFVLLRDV